MLSITYLLELFLDTLIIFILIILLSKLLFIKLSYFFNTPRLLYFFVLYATSLFTS
jgi:hypothetical protein